MKKVIAILAVLVVLVGAVFAASGDALKIQANVGQHKPAFTMYGGTTSAAAADTLAKQTPAAINTNTDISTTNAVVYIRIAQAVADSNSAKIKYKGSVTLTIEGTALVNTDTAITTNNATAAPVASDASGNGAASGAACVVTAAVDGTDKNKVNITAAYTGHPVDPADSVATCKYTWTKDANLAQGSYEATITLTTSAI